MKSEIKIWISLKETSQSITFNFDLSLIYIYLCIVYFLF